MVRNGLNQFTEQAITYFRLENETLDGYVHYAESLKSLLLPWNIHLVRTQKFPEIQQFLPLDTHTYVCVSRGKKG